MGAERRTAWADRLSCSRAYRQQPDSSFELLALNHSAHYAVQWLSSILSHLRTTSSSQLLSRQSPSHAGPGLHFCPAPPNSLASAAAAVAAAHLLTIAPLTAPSRSAESCMRSSRPPRTTPG